MIFSFLWKKGILQYRRRLAELNQKENSREKLNKAALDDTQVLFSSFGIKEAGYNDSEAAGSKKSTDPMICSKSRRQYGIA